MRIHNAGRKHYYVYQSGKRVGTVTKKKDVNVVNNAPVTISRSNWIRSGIYYGILIALAIPCFFFPIAHSVIICLCLLGTHIQDPYNLDSKTDLYIKRPTGTIELTDAYDFKTNANVTLRRRREFLSIRFACMIGAFTMTSIVLIETMIKASFDGATVIILCMYSIAYIFLVYLTIRKYIQAMKITKLEREEQDKALANQ